MHTWVVQQLQEREKRKVYKYIGGEAANTYVPEISQTIRGDRQRC